MSSIQDLNQKVILFAGRLSDSRKGLSLFLEAVEILTGLTGLPSFAIWIVGGSLREVRQVSFMIDRLRALAELRHQGRILLWGRIENSALAEIYSRACVTVIPSHREEFGIVAVEAMMSGCPVVAANTGGLADVIVAGETGTLFEPGDSLALAASVCTYLRNAQQRDVYGAAGRQRAQRLFAKGAALNRVACLYDSDSAPRTAPDSCSRQSDSLTPDRLERLQTVFDTKELSISRANTGRHPVFMVEFGARQFIAKFFTPRFSLQASLFPSANTLSLARGGKISYCREIFNRDNPVAPAIKFFEEGSEPLIVTERAEQIEGASEQTDESVCKALRTSRDHNPLQECPEVSDYLSSLSDFSTSPTKVNLDRFDLASAILNSRMTEGELTLCRTHPQVELKRFQWLMNDNVWPIPLDFRIRCNQILQLLLESQDIIVEKPLLAHGDPKPEHILLGGSGEVLVADFEHSRYAVGPTDIALWLSFTGIRGRLETNALDVVRRVCRQCQTRQERYLCICWVVSEVIFFALHRFTCGESREMQVTHNFLRDLGMVLLNSEVIQ